MLQEELFSMVGFSPPAFLKISLRKTHKKKVSVFGQK